MTHLKTMTIVAATALMGFSAPSFAQDTGALKDKAIDMAKDKIKSKAKTMAVDKAGGMGGMAAEKGVDVGADMMKGKSAKDAAMDAAMDSGKSSASDSLGLNVPSIGGTSLGGAALGGTTGLATSAVKNTTTDEKIKAGKILLKGGSKEDAAMAIAKDRAKDSLMDKAKGLVSTQAGSMTDKSKTSLPMADTAPVATTTVVNCPAGTTAQSNGTCMITGNYQGGN